MVRLKNSLQIAVMAEAGKIAAQALQGVLKVVDPGVKTKELERMAEEEITKKGGRSAFKRVQDYSYTTCMTVNEEVVHGLPSEYQLKEGDILGIDLGAFYHGYYSDLATTVYVGKSPPKEVERFLEVGKTTLDKAIEETQMGNRIGDISECIQKNIEGAGYSVVKEFVGHGIGEDLHEDPSIPGLGKEGEGILIEEGLVIAIEIIYNMGGAAVRILPDGWTVVTADAQPSGLFEHTVAVTRKGPLILTKL